MKYYVSHLLYLGLPVPKGPNCCCHSQNWRCVVVADPGGVRGMRPHPPQLGQKFFGRLYFGHCGETADQNRIPFGVIGRTGPGMRQVVGFGDRSTGRGTFGGEFRARHCNHWGLYGVVYTFAATRPSSQITLGLLLLLLSAVCDKSLSLNVY